MKLPYAGTFARLRHVPGAVNFGWLTLDRASRLTVGVALSVWMARVLGPGDFGRLNYALAIAAMIGVVPTLGLDAVLRRELVRTPTESGRLLGTAFCLRIATSLICYAGLAAVTLAHTSKTAPASVILILGVTLVQPAVQTIDAWFHARLEARIVVLAQNAAFLIGSAARAAVLWWQPEIEWIAMAMILDLPIGAVLVMAAYRRSDQRLATWRFDPATSRAFLKDAGPLVISSMAIMVYHRIDQVMLPTLAGATEAGHYAAAVRMVELWNFVPMGLAASWAPSLVQAQRAGAEAFSAATERQFRRHAAIAWALALVTAASAPWLLPLLFGAPYAPAGTIAMVLALSFPFVALGIARSEVWVVCGRASRSLPAAVLGALANVLLNLWWIPRWGAMGAAAATVVSYSLAAVGATFCWGSDRGIGIQQVHALALRGMLWGRRSSP